MEDVLAIYTRPRDPDRPLVCLDETSKQLTAETRLPIPMKPGRPARCDYEYERNGVANLFMMFAPLEGWRCVEVSPDNRSGPGQSQHPQQSFALRGLPGRRSPAAGRAVRMALDAKTRQLAQSGQSELGVLSSQCLDRRITDKQVLTDEVAAWQHDRNKNHAKPDWRFTTANARIKLKHLYPSI